MFNSTANKPSVLKIAVAVSFSAALAFSPLALAEEHELGKESLDAAAGKTVTGEVVDMMCYVDHNAYLVVGEHKPINDELAEYCGKSITVKGKVAERGGIAMIENAEIVKK